MKKILVFILLLSVAVSSVACKKKRTKITGEERTQVLAYANPIVDELLTGYNETDYVKYSSSFDEKMKNAIPENVFKQTNTMMMGKIGKYLSREVSKVYKKAQYIVVKYKAKFENEEVVKIRVVFQKYGDKNLISGLWFKSPKLKK
jgi:hypothetical protein